MVGKKQADYQPQRVIRQYDIQGEVIQLEIDVYDNAGDLNDLDCSFRLIINIILITLFSPKIKKQ